MPGDEGNSLAAHLICHRDRLLRIAGVVANLEVELLAEHAAGRVDVFDGEFGPVLHLRAEGSVLTRHRADHCDRGGGAFPAFAAANHQDGENEGCDQPGHALHCYLPLLDHIHSTTIVARQGALGAPVAPGQWARAFVKPAILRHHLRRPRKTKSKAGAREKHDIGHETVIGGKQRAVEQGVMEEADRGGEQRHMDKHPPERFPRSRQALPREERCPAADDDGEHEEDAETVVGEEAHVRAPPAPWAPPSRYAALTSSASSSSRPVPDIVILPFTMT